MLPAGELVLSPLGIPEGEERAYWLLLERPGLTAAEITRALEEKPTRLRGLLRSLEDRGMVTRSAGRPPRYSPAPPAVAVELLILRRQEELERARLAVANMTEVFQASKEPLRAADEVVELVSGREAVIQAFRQVEQSAQEEVLVFDRPPYAIEAEENEPYEDDMLKRGVRCRVVYDRSSLLMPRKLESIERSAGAGEEARTADDLPMKLVVSDREIGMIPMQLNEPGLLEGAMLVHPSPLLEAIVMLFEMIWERALPFPVGQILEQLEEGEMPRPSDAPSRGEREAERLLPLLLAGLKDEAMARQLGTNIRTVQRRVRRLLDALGATTRFQAGWLAAERRRAGGSEDISPPMGSTG